MRKLFFFLSLSLLVITCKKKDGSTGNGGPNPPPVIPPSVVKTTYTVDSASTQPGFYLTLTADKKILRDTATVLLGTTPVLLIKLDTLHYGFYVPAINAGTQTLDLKNIDAANTPTLLIRSYTAITNPDAIITQQINEYNQLTDSLLINSLNNSVTSADAQFMHQLMDQLLESIKLITGSEKLNLAYQFQNMTLNKSWGQKTDLDTAYLTFRLYGADDEISMQLTQKARNLVSLLGPATASVPAVFISISAAIAFPNPYTVSAALITIAAYCILTSGVGKAAGDVVDITGIAGDNLNEENNTGTASNPVAVQDNETIWEKLSSKFRTLQKTDNTSFNQDISQAIDGSAKLETEDNSIKTSFSDLKNRLKNYFEKITTDYQAYISPILVKAKEKTAEAKAKFITISNISNPKISIVATDDGVKGLKLTFTNPDKSITTETPFTFQLTYNQNSINRKVNVTQHAKFIVSSVQVSTATPTGVTYSSANIGGTVSVTGTVTISGRGICYGKTQNPTFEQDSKITAGSGTGSFTGNLISLDPAVKYFARAYAISNATVIYGNQVDFTTTSINLATIITNGATAITSTTATLGGYISNDGGAPVILRGLCYGTTQNPTYENNLKTTDGTGTGTFLSFLSNLLPDKTYYARAYAITLAGVAYGGNVDFKTSQLAPEEVAIGNQVWMVKNLDVTTYRNGDPIPEITTAAEWASTTTGAWCYYENTPTHGGGAYLKLYNWYAVNDPRGLAPLGWHIPSFNEWTTLVNFLGGEAVAGGKLKSTNLWQPPNTGATNSSGFTGYPGGATDLNGYSSSLSAYGYWWTTTDNVTPTYPYNAWAFLLNWQSAAGSLLNNVHKNFGCSVRCVKN